MDTCKIISPAEPRPFQQADLSHKQSQNDFDRLPNGNAMKNIDEKTNTGVL
jgi:hypothetical protein